MIIFWDEMQFWILQFCQTRFWSVTIFRFMMSHHFWVTISDSSLWLILFSSFSTRLTLYILFIFNLQVYLHWLFSKWQKFFFQGAQKCQISKSRNFSRRTFILRFDPLGRFRMEMKSRHNKWIKNTFLPLISCKITFLVQLWHDFIFNLDSDGSKFLSSRNVWNCQFLDLTFGILFEFSNFSVILVLTVSPSP